MSYDESFRDVLAIGDSDEEDPVFEIGTKKKKYKKTHSIKVNVSAPLNDLVDNNFYIPKSVWNYKLDYLPLFIQKSKEEKKFSDTLTQSTAPKKRRRNRGGKKKHERMTLGEFNSYLRIPFYNFIGYDIFKIHQRHDLTNSNIEGREVVEEIKTFPAKNDTTAAEEIFSFSYSNPEEAKLSNDFIAKYKECKKAEDYDNQSVMEDLAEERYFGNTEYKLKLCCPTPEREIRLTTQMKFRIQEGNGEAFYEIGVGDKGEAFGISPEEMEASLRTLHRMARSLKAEIFIRSVRKGRKGEICKVMVM